MDDTKKTSNSRVGRRYLPWQAKSISRTRQDIKSWNRALDMFRQAEEPQNWQLQLLYGEIMLDALVASQKANRDNQVFSAPFSLKKPNGDVDEDQTLALKKNPLYRFFTQAVIDEDWFGYNLVELSLGGNDRDRLSATLIPRYNVVPQLGRFYPDYTDMTNFINYRDLPEFGTWILEFNSGYEGMANKLVAPTLLTRFAESCWSELCEIYGIPPRVMKTNTQDATALNRAEKMMRDMGAASWFIIDETEEFEFAKGIATNGDVYKNLINHLRDKICQLIVGGLIGQDTQNGSRSKDEVSFEMLWLLVQSDMARLEEAWNNTIIPALVQHGVLKGDLTFEFDQAEDVEQLWKFTQGLLNYYNVDPEWVKDKFGIEVTGERQSLFLDERNLSLSGGDGFFLQAPESGASSCGSHHIQKLALPKGAPESSNLINRVAKAEGKLTFDPDTFNATFKTLEKGLKQGLKKKPSKGSLQLAIQTAYGIDDPHLLTSYELNLHRFSAGKTLAEVQALNDAFRKAKSFDIFKTNAKQIGDVFNEQWLETEYNTAILIGESAATYHSLMRDVDTFPYWEYRTVGDHAVRAEHAKLDGLILPANDPLWQLIYPPNGWNCRCYVVARMRHEVEGRDFDAERARVRDYFGSDEFDRASAQGLGVNRAVSGEVFTANQQYIAGKNLTETNKALNSLGADDYGLNAYQEAKAAAKANQPVYSGSAGDWLENLDLLNDRRTVYDYNRRALAVNPSSFDDHAAKTGRQELLAAVTEALSKPSEVWARGQRATGKMDNIVYLKYYKDNTIVVIGSQNRMNIVELRTWFKLSEKEEVIARYRRGLLIKK